MIENRFHANRVFAVGCAVCAIALMFIFAFPSECPALKPGEVSLAAEFGAGFRAVAAKDPDAKIRNPDYLAEELLPPDFWFLSSLNRDYKKSKAFIRFYGINGYYTANAVTFHIDDILKKCASEGVRQVVNIGAGFDSRPYRFGKQMPHVRFFEVDQPATMAKKKERVKAVLGELPDGVTYLPVDYRIRDIFDELKMAGYDEKKKTLFIWEEVTRYTDRGIVDLTMRSIAEHSAPGSEVVFTYVFDEVVRGDFSKYRSAWFQVFSGATGGEPWKFGIPEGRAEEYVSQRGLKVISHLSSGELAKKYLVRSDGTVDGNPKPFGCVIHARVQP